MSAAARHSVEVGAYPSDGHAALTPLQDSAASHEPFAGRHSTVGAANASVGQVGDVPSQTSATSHRSDAVRHSTPLTFTHVPSAGAPAATLHAWQSVRLPCPHCESQQTPSTQKFETHSLSSEHVVAMGLPNWTILEKTRSCAYGGFASNLEYATRDAPSPAEETTLRPEKVGVDAMITAGPKGEPDVDIQATEVPLSANQVAT